MQFNTPLFAAFLALFLVLFHAVARTRTHKLWTILLGSLGFYAAWDYRFVPLLVGTALFNFYMAREVARSQDTRARAKRLVAAGIVGNLGILAYFKLATTLTDWTKLEIVIPLGLSFFVFRSMSYPIDVYRRSVRPRESPLEFVSAVTFFPHLVAGPIARWATLFPQFEKPSSMTREHVKRGLLFIAIGSVNKTIADLLSTIPDAFYREFSHGSHGALHAWTAVLAYAGTIYGDFAGYSALAIGIALLLGVQLPANFNLPYLATSIVDFWQRWHISLSTWFRDYLFLPMALRYPTHPYLLTMLTMVLVGLWHGASALFIVFGCYHGVVRVVSTVAGSRLRPAAERLPDAIVKVVSLAMTFYLVVVGFVLFRSDSLRQAVLVLRDMHAPPDASAFTSAAMSTLGLTVLGLVGCHLVSWLETARAQAARVLWRPAVFWPTVVAGIAGSALLASATKPFIYSHF